MKRTREEAAQMRAAILDAAERLFVERGFSAVALADIAQVAGCTRGAVYWHFKDKLGLLFALRDKEKASVQELAERLAADHDIDPFDGLVQTIDNFFIVLAQNSSRRALLKMTMNVVLSGEKAQDGDDRDRIFKQELHVNLCHIFHLADARHSLASPWTPETAALALHALVCGLITEWLLGDAVFSMENEAGDIVRRFVRCLCEKKGQP